VQDGDDVGSGGCRSVCVCTVRSVSGCVSVSESSCAIALACALTSEFRSTRSFFLIRPCRSSAPPFLISDWSLNGGAGGPGLASPRLTLLYCAFFLER
jgi:hypothetical protein